MRRKAIPASPAFNCAPQFSNFVVNPVLSIALRLVGDCAIRAAIFSHALRATVAEFIDARDARDD